MGIDDLARQIKAKAGALAGGRVVKTDQRMRSRFLAGIPGPLIVDPERDEAFAVLKASDKSGCPAAQRAPRVIRQVEEHLVELPRPADDQPLALVVADHRDATLLRSRSESRRRVSSPGLDIEQGHA